MSSRIRSLMWCYGLAMAAATCGVGCTHLIETRAITAFSKNLEAENLDGLMKSTTDEFHQRALRTATALEDLKILNLPDGKTTIVETKDVSASRKRVTVQVGEGKKEIFYELVRDDAGRWVVDDIYLKQKRKGVEAYKSVTEQMDLLLSVREFLDTWSRGDRNEVLSVVSAKFREVLDPLPPTYLASLTRIVAAGRPTGGRYKPNAQLDEKLAIVRLPRMSGESVISLELIGDHWQVTDVAIDSKDDDKLPSMFKMAMAVNNCTAFLTAYNRGDKSSLEQWSDHEFFEGSLSIGDLGQVKLPDDQLSDHELQVKLRGDRADFVLRNDAELVQIDMHRKPDGPPKFVVSDVTIYEIETKQEKRLSALFTAQGMLEIFVQALASRDIETLRHAATQDFASRVWSKIKDPTVAGMPLEPFDGNDVEFVTASFQGALTKVEVRQSGRPMTYFLREERGRFFVDDVQWQITGLPSSLKTTLEILLPIQDFAAAVALGREPQDQDAALELLQASSSSDFNRMVWNQTRFVPNSGMSADTFLKAPIKGIAQSDHEVIVQFGDNRYGARVTLRREFERYVVDDVLLVAGPEDSQRLALKHSLRTQLASGEARAPQAVVPASAVREAASYQSPKNRHKSSGNADPSGNVEPAGAIDPFADELNR